MPARAPDDTRTRLNRRLADASGFSLIELLIAMVIAMVMFGTTLTALQVMTGNQNRDQAYAQEVTSTEVSFARLLHDLRQATLFTSVTPNSVAFQMAVAGTTYNVAYNCTAADSLGGSYTRCARTQAVAPTAAPAPGATASSTDIQHVWQGGISRFCNAGGTAPSGSVFLPSNPNITNTDGGGLACDEAYEQEVASLQPTYIQVHVQVPASGSLKSGGLTHQTVLSSGVYIPNLDAGS
jgi:prepilin-type N-terminal cleavage/methylation domain-containing protein